MKRLRLELDESVGRVRARAEGLGKGLDQAKEELVSLLNAKVFWSWRLPSGLGICSFLHTRMESSSC